MRFLLSMTILCLVGCGGKSATPLMASPSLFQAAKLDPYASYSAAQRTNKVDVFYVTTRQRVGGPLVRYSNSPGDSTRYGNAKVILGGEDTRFERLRDASVGTAAAGSIHAAIDDIEEFGGKQPDHRVDDFIQQVNRGLSGLRSKEITIYVHGFNTGFLEAITRLAQIRHLMGQQQLGIAYCWPCGQSPFNYHNDVKKGLQDAENLADLLKLLAEKTDAEQINLIGYSAGAPSLSRGLYLRSQQIAGAANPQRESKIGVVMFQSADIDLQTFGEQEIKSYYRICDRIIVTVCHNDWALKLASTVNRRRRLGGAWGSGMTRQQLAEMDQATRIEFVDLSYSDGRRPNGFDGHFFWQSHPWGVSDLLLAMQFHLSAGDRALARRPGGGFWYFPSDYIDRLGRISLPQGN